jgi:hypothetical protein
LTARSARTRRGRSRRDGRREWIPLRRIAMFGGTSRHGAGKFEIAAMVTISITAEAYEAIKATLPEGADASKLRVPKRTRGAEAGPLNRRVPAPPSASTTFQNPARSTRRPRSRRSAAARRAALVGAPELDVGRYLNLLVTADAEEFADLGNVAMSERFISGDVGSCSQSVSAFQPAAPPTGSPQTSVRAFVCSSSLRFGVVGASPRSPASTSFPGFCRSSSDRA